ncbi:cyclic nucleotide-gated ion channel [Enhydrobacter aerosaccus]|uniref:cyclic nucleotide-gated ion channel n=1 Tax=Enhydrobacter aerosaccus TaxID=225324 RepID=UPI0014830362|nr:cyclic nucleotide-gated ion channel [Enhydrobacter aerosaccus]
MPATSSTLGERLYTALKPTDSGAGSRRWQSFHLFALGAGLLAVTLSSVDSLPDLANEIASFVIMLVAVVFLVEYALRLWTAPEAPNYAGHSEMGARIRWACSPIGLIGLLAIVPAFAISVHAVGADSDLAALFCILWILKLGVHAPALGTLARVISNERATLASVLIIFIIVLVSAATATYFFERARQPEAFSNLPAALWWAVVTLTTTGYGDIVPLTTGGRIVGSVVMVSGILVLALMTGILATGFAEEERRREYLRVWDQVVKVPMFAELGTVTLSEIVGKLRVRHYPPRFVVVRRDEPGDAMFFISEGEVEVRLPHEPVRLGQGGFFGEMALLDRLPRSATIVTTQPTTLLVLYASDFYEIAAHIPSLVAAVEKEARRRRQENESGKAAVGTQR